MIDPLQAMAPAWFAWCAAISVQLVPLALLAVCLDAVLRRCGPVVRGALWWAVMARLVLPTDLATPLGVAAIVPAAVRVPAVDASPAWIVPAFLIWLAGVLLCAAAARRRYLRLRRQCLDDAAPAPASIQRLADAAAGRLGGLAPPVRISAGVTSPAAIGFIRPIVLLPPGMLAIAPEMLEHVLLHEIAHVRRRDPLACLASLTAQIVFWFHPAVWWARRRLSILCELACDRTVARVLGDETSAYRRSLIVLAHRAVTPAAGAPPVGALGLFQRRSQLLARIDALAASPSLSVRAERGLAAALATIISISCASFVPRGSTLSAFDMPPIDQLPGSLQKRYAVMRALALEEARSAR